MVIGEIASEERGGSKADWITQHARSDPDQYRKVRALIWFDEKDQGMHWPIGSSKTAQAAFNTAISRPLFMPGLYSGQPQGKILPPSWTPPPPEASPPVTGAAP